MKIALIALISLLSLSQLPEDKIQLVYDDNHYLSADDSLAIDSALVELNKNNITMGIYITDVVKDKKKNIDKEARKMGHDIGWGLTSNNNGAILYIAMVDQKLYVAFDKGLPYTDAQAQLVVDTILPYFKNRKYKDGILQGIKQMQFIVAQN